MFPYLFVISHNVTGTLALGFDLAVWFFITQVRVVSGGKSLKIMALSSTIYKVDLSVADMDRNYYEQFQLTLACHPSETIERMMLRLVVFARHASQRLKFTRGISSDNEPDLWEHHDHGAINLWIELGLPEERRIRQACGRSDAVAVYVYGDRAWPVWWRLQEPALCKLDKLKVWMVTEVTLALLADRVRRTMQLSCSIQDGLLWLADDHASVEVGFELLFTGAG